MWKALEHYTLDGLLERRAEQYPDKVFLYLNDVPLTYGEVWRRSTAAANRLTQLGVGAGDTVAVFLETCPEYVDVLFACARIGAIYAPVNTAFRGDFLRHQLRDSGTKVIVVDGSLMERLAEVAGEDLPELKVAIVRNTEGQDACKISGIDVFSISTLAEASDAALVGDHDVRWNALSALLYTSGTTGPAKGVELTSHYLVTAGKTLAELWKLQPDETIYAAVPLYHFSGMLGAVTSTLVTGSTAVLDSWFSVRATWDRIRKYGAAGFIGVGPMVVMLYNLPPDPSDADLPLRFISAAPIPTELWRKIEQRYNCECTSVYGMTECFPITVLGVGSGGAPGSAGSPNPNFDVQLVDANDEEIAAGEVGEIVARPRAPHVMFEGYSGRPEATVAQMRNLWFHTGDLGRFDEQGNLWYVDRKKDAIRRRGENISSFEVERVLATHPAVAEIAVIAVPSPVSEEDVKACLVLAPDADLGPIEFMDFCGEKLPFFAVPRYLEFVDDLPRNATGRILKFQLRDDPVNARTWDREAAGYKVKR